MHLNTQISLQKCSGRSGVWRLLCTLLLQVQTQMIYDIDADFLVSRSLSQQNASFWQNLEQLSQQHNVIAFPAFEPAMRNPRLPDKQAVAEHSAYGERLVITCVL